MANPSGDAGSSTVARAITDFPSRPRLILRGLTRRCAWCGDWRAFFVGWFRRREQCRACGHGYRRGDSAFELGAVTANIILTFLSLGTATLLAIVLTLPQVSVTAVMVAGGATAVLGPALFYPISFTLWQAIDLWMRRPTPAELAGQGDATL